MVSLFFHLGFHLDTVKISDTCVRKVNNDGSCLCWLLIRLCNPLHTIFLFHFNYFQYSA